MAGWTGLEPAAFCVTGRRSNQLSYHPVPERRANVDREIGKSSAVCAGGGSGRPPPLFVDTARFRPGLLSIAFDEDHHRAAADLAVVIELRRQFFRRRSRDLKALQT